MTERRDPLSVRSTKLELAVRLVDEVTGDRPIGNQKVSVEGVTDPLPANRSGDYLVLASDGRSVLPDRRVTVSVDGGRHYFDVEEAVSPSDDAAAVFRLPPAPAYPFPPGTTLARGSVQKADGEVRSPVAGATVSIGRTDLSTVTDDRGGFALVVADDPSITVATERIGGEPKRLVKVRKKTPKLIATVDDRTRSAKRRIEEGALTVQNFIF